MHVVLWFLACSGGGDTPAEGDAARRSPPGPTGHAAPGPGAEAQAARSAPSVSTPWDGPWTLTGVYAPTPDDPGAAALGASLASPVRAWTGGRPATRPGEVVVVWVPAGAGLEETARALAPRTGPQGDVVVALGPGDATWRADAAARLPWSGVALVDPTVSATRWLDAPPEAPLAARIAAREVADHYALPYIATTDPLSPGLDAYLGTWNPAFLRSPDPRTRTEGVRAAGRLAASGTPPGAAAPPDLADLARDLSVAVRLAVAAVTRDAALLAALAADTDPTVRARATDAVDDIALLARLVDDPSSVVRVLATHRLGALAAARPVDVGPVLRRVTTSPNAYQRWKAAWGLGYVPGSVDALVPLLTDPDIDVRREAARSLGRLRDPAAVTPLLAALRDENSFVRRWAATALGELRDPRARDPLRAAAAEPTALVAQAAARALGAFGERVPAPPFTPPGKPRDDAALDALLASPDATVRKDAAKFLAGRPDTARLARLAADPDSEVRKTAVEAMGWHAKTAPAAAAFLSDPDPDTQITALEALRRASAGSVGLLAPLVSSPDAEVRLRAAEALAALGPSPELAPLLDDPDERVRAAVAAVYPDRVRPDEPSILVRRAARAADPDPLAAPPGVPLGGWADGVFAREDDLLHMRFSWNDAADAPSAHRALRPPVIGTYGHPNRG